MSRRSRTRKSAPVNSGSIARPERIEVKNAAPQAAAAPSGKEESIVAPMAGNILDVKVKVGDAVQKGQVVAILEAMKLENEVVATASGTVKQVLVSKGTAVTNQQAIIIVG